MRREADMRIALLAVGEGIERNLFFSYAGYTQPSGVMLWCPAQITPRVLGTPFPNVFAQVAFRTDQQGREQTDTEEEQLG